MCYHKNDDDIGACEAVFICSQEHEHTSSCTSPVERNITRTRRRVYGSEAAAVNKGRESELFLSLTKLSKPERRT